MIPASDSLIHECFRWYGPRDTVTLDDIRQCGATGVYTALHEIPYGQAWPRDEIRRRKAELATHGLKWVAVEPVPVSEAIKSRTGDCNRHLENYCETLRSLGAEGVSVVLNCFMPVLEWVRTDLSRTLPDGKQCLSFNPVEFAAFEIYLLKRQSAEADYTPEQLEAAERFFASKSRSEQRHFGERIGGMLPGVQTIFSIEQLRERLSVYEEVDAARLRANLAWFLQAVVPVAEQSGVRLAMHPDDPPIPILGLPRILSTEADYSQMLAMVDSPANGICFCTGSLGSRPDNDLPGMVERLGSRIHALHLRNVQREARNAFYESDHLGGSVDMPAVVEAILREQAKRRAQGRSDWRLSMRPDHGHVMLDDLVKPPAQNPGYTCLGRMRGLAELRGLQHGIASMLR